MNNIITLESVVTFHVGSFDPPLIDASKANFAYGPNPFDPRKESIMIKYDLNANTDTDLYIYDVTGNMICRKFYPYGTNGGNSGTNRVFWDGRNDFKETVANGVYLFRVVSEGRTIGKGKMIVLK